MLFCSVLLEKIKEAGIDRNSLHRRFYVSTGVLCYTVPILHNPFTQCA